jgi:hypothetical protein
VVGAANKWISSTRNSNNGQISQGFVDHTYCFFIHFFIQNKETKSRFRTICFVPHMFEYVPTLCPGYQFIPYYYRKIGFDIDSFSLIGCGLSKEVLASVGYKPLQE